MGAERHPSHQDILLGLVEVDPTRVRIHQLKSVRDDGLEQAVQTELGGELQIDLSQRLQLGRALAERLFGFSTLGDVDQGSLDRRRLALCIANQVGVFQNPDGLTIPAAQAGFEVGDCIVGLQLGDEQLPAGSLEVEIGSCTL